MDNNSIPDDRRLPLEARVLQSVQRLGFKQVTVRDEGEGVIRIVAPDTSPNERRIIMAAARAVAGVQRVSVEE